MKKKAVGAAMAVLVMAVLGSAVLMYDWGFTSDPQEVPFAPAGDGTLSAGSLNFTLFDVYGPLLLILGILMFGAMIGASCVAREEVDEDDSD